MQLINQNKTVTILESELIDLKLKNSCLNDNLQHLTKENNDIIKEVNRLNLTESQSQLLLKDANLKSNTLLDLERSEKLALHEVWIRFHFFLILEIIQRN